MLALKATHLQCTARVQARCVSSLSVGRIPNASLTKNRINKLPQLSGRAVAVRSQDERKVFISGFGNGGGSGPTPNEGRGGNGGHPLRLWTFVLAATILGGGVTAFIKKKSKASLIASSISSLVLFICASLLAGSSSQAAARAAFAACVLLGGIMAKRAYAAKKFFPAGIVAALTLPTAAAFAFVGL